jgi:hypothetical protein
VASQHFCRTLWLPRWRDAPLLLGLALAYVLAGKAGLLLATASPQITLVRARQEGGP